MTYRRSSIKPRGGLSNFGHSRGGVIGEGELFTKSSGNDMYESFSVLLPHILWIHESDTKIRYILHAKHYHNGCASFSSETFGKSLIISGI